MSGMFSAGGGSNVIQIFFFNFHHWFDLLATDSSLNLRENITISTF